MELDSKVHCRRRRCVFFYVCFGVFGVFGPGLPADSGMPQAWPSPKIKKLISCLWARPMPVAFSIYGLGLGGLHCLEICKVKVAKLRGSDSWLKALGVAVVMGGLPICSTVQVTIVQQQSKIFWHFKPKALNPQPFKPFKP